MNSTHSLNVVVPCYNPPLGWEQGLADRFGQLKQVLGALSGNIRLVVVNDGSARNAGPEQFEHLKQLIPEVVVVTYPENRGKGYALRAGVQASEAEMYLVTDTDFPYTMGSMAKVVQHLRDHGGIAAGNRDTAYYAHVPPFRRWLSKSLRWMLRNVLRQPIDDSQCGLKAFDAQGKAIFLKTEIDRFLFDLEFLLLAKGKVPVEPVPVELRGGVVFSKVGWRILATEGLNFLQLLVKNTFK